MGLDFRRVACMAFVTAIILTASAPAVSAKGVGGIGGDGMSSGASGGHPGGGIRETGGMGVGGTIKPVESGFGGFRGRSGTGISSGFNGPGVEGLRSPTGGISGGFHRPGIGEFGERREEFEHGSGERRFSGGFFPDAFGFGGLYPYAFYEPYYTNDPDVCYQSCVESGNDPSVCAESCYSTYTPVY